MNKNEILKEMTLFFFLPNNFYTQVLKNLKFELIFKMESKKFRFKNQKKSN